MAGDSGAGSYDAWQRKALITVTFYPVDTEIAMQFHALTETIDIDIGEKDLDVIQLLNANQIAKHGSIGITTVTFEGYPKSAGSAAAGAADGWWDMFANYPSMDTGDPYENVITDNRHRCRVAILWTNDAAATAGVTAVAQGNTYPDDYEGLRFMMADCFCTSCKPSFTDGVMKWTMTFKGVAFDTAGAGNIKIESVKSVTDVALDAPTAYEPGVTKW